MFCKIENFKKVKSHSKFEMKKVYALKKSDTDEIDFFDVNKVFNNYRQLV